MTYEASAPLRVGILGASGYGGAGLLRRLAAHPNAQVTAVGSRQYEGQTVAECWPQLTGVYGDLRFSSQEEVISESDVVFCATPHGATAPLVDAALQAGKCVLDLSADYRLPIDLYEQWYGAHPHPEHYKRARYGLVELHRAELKGSELIAVPGCNSSTVNLALAPLAANGLLGDTTIASLLVGVSGAGRAPNQRLHFSEVNENARPYKVAGTHRHTAEVELTMGRINEQGKTLSTHQPVSTVPTVSFNPHLVPMTRGIMATCYTQPDTASSLSDETLLELYKTFYADDPMMVVQGDLPQTKAVYGSDRCIVSVRFDKRSGHIIAFGVTDNLGRGAAGQAMQCFNLMHGFDETCALNVAGVWP